MSENDSFREAGWELGRSKEAENRCKKNKQPSVRQGFPEDCAASPASPVHALPAPIGINFAAALLSRRTGKAIRQRSTPA
jgi:hypothetical protein